MSGADAFASIARNNPKNSGSCQQDERSGDVQPTPLPLTIA